MLKIKKLKIENFRGIKSPVTIEFYKGNRPTSALIYGRNGTGKSSIVDGWEWIINSKIEYLSKEGISERDYPHKLSNGDNSYVEIDLDHADINSVKAVFNKDRIKSPIITGEFEGFKAQSIYPNYLRYSDLQEFVYKRKGDKYKYIAKFFGLEEFLKNQANLKSSYTKNSRQLDQLNSQLQDGNQRISSLLGDVEINEDNIISFINTIGCRYNLDEITEFRNSKKIEKELSEIVKANPIAVELSAWKAFKIKLNQFYNLPKIVDDFINIESVFNELKEDESNVTKLILIELYSSSVDVLSKLKVDNQCPVCDNIFDGNLTNHITEKHKILHCLNEKKLDYIAKRNSSLTKLELIQRKIDIIKSESNKTILSTFNRFFTDIEDVSKSITIAISILKTKFEDLTVLSLSKDSNFIKVDSISDNEFDNKSIIDRKIKELSDDENSKMLVSNYSKIIKIRIEYSKTITNEKKVIYLSNITTKLYLVLAKLTLFIQQKIQDVFTAIQTDVNYCYNFLESSNQFLKNPKIKLVEELDKAVELEIEFADEIITPAYKFMSESQVNSFGLAIFLSAVKYFNNDFKFMILDDVVNSFDAFKRPKISQLLANRFGDFQVLMLTHDQIFFDTVQRDFPQWNRYKFSSWDYTTGPRCSFTRNYIEEIERLIEDDDPIGAGLKLGRYLEMVFGIVNQNLKTPIQYKLENVYTLSEFYNPLVKRFKDKLKLRPKIHIVSKLFSEFEQGTIFRNYCAHYKNESAQFTSDEINAIFQKWLEIEAQIYCESCKSYCRLEKIGNTEFVKCNCSALDLKDESKFEDI